jgi:hypothetical protein
MMMASYFNFFFLDLPRTGHDRRDDERNQTRGEESSEEFPFKLREFSRCVGEEIAVLLRLEFCFLVCLQLLDSILELVNVAIRNVGGEASFEEASGEWARKPG